MRGRWLSGSVWLSVFLFCTRRWSLIRWKRKSVSLRRPRRVFSPDPVMSSGRVLENRYCRLPFTTLKVVVLANVPSDIVRILGPGEQVELYIQQKIYHPKINVDSVVLTTQRIILRHAHELVWKRDLTDFDSTDLVYAVVDRGVHRR